MTGVPSRFWQRNYNGVFSSVTERGRVAVYYPYIERSTGSGKTKTYYLTTAGIDNACPQSGFVHRIKTLRYQRGNSGLTLIQNNEDHNWGRPYLTQVFDAAGKKLRQSCTEYDFSENMLGLAWNELSFGGQDYRIHWRFPDRVVESSDYVYEQRSYSISKTSAYDYYSPVKGGELKWHRESDSRNNGIRRLTEYTYANQKYPEMDALNILSPIVQQDVSDEASGTKEFHQSTVTTWKGHDVVQFQGQTPKLWRPYQTYAWRANVPSSGSRIFSDWTGVVTTNKCADGQDTDCWQLSSTNQSYNDNGYLTNVKDGLGVSTIFNYRTGEGYNGAYLTRVTRQGLSSNFEYDLRWGLLSKVTGPSGREQSYVYDAFGPP